MVATDKPAPRVTGQLCSESGGATRSGAQHGGVAPARRRAFTLIEVLLVIAAVAMLAAIAYPNYVGYKVRANRVATQAFMLELAIRQQLHFLDARGYAGSLSQLGAASLPSEIGAYYSIPDPVVDNTAAPPTFMLSALAKAGTIQAADGDIGINSAGVRSGRW